MREMHIFFACQRHRGRPGIGGDPALEDPVTWRSEIVGDCGMGEWPWRRDDGMVGLRCAIAACEDCDEGVGSNGRIGLLLT